MLLLNPSAGRSRLLHPSVALLALCLVLLGTPGCEPPAAEPVAETVAAAAAAAVHHYEMTGEVLSVAPAPVAGLSRVKIQHEAVPDFRDLETGDVVGMAAMPMSFPLAAGLAVPTVGERVAFTLRVDGGDHGGLPYVIEGIRPEAGGAGPAAEN